MTPLPRENTRPPLLALAVAIRTLLTAIGLIVAATVPAWADCEDGVALLIPKLSAVTDPHLRALLVVDLKQAQLDLWELDEVECATALSHAARLLKFGQ